MSLLRRQHLLSAIQHVPIALLLGPSGYGKTVLMAQAAGESQQLPVRLDFREVEHDLRSLIEDLAASLETFAPEAAQAIEQANADRPLPAKRLARLLEHVPPLHFFLDHAERLTEETQAWLVTLIRHLPAQHRLMLAARHMSSAEVASLVAAQRIRVFGPEQLAFGDAEVLALAQTHQFENLAALEAQHGWPMGVALTVAGAYGHSAGDLIRALLSSLPPTFQLALPHLAPYDHWTPYLPAALNLPLPPDWLGVLINQRFPLQQQGGGVQPHEQVLTVLDEQLRLNRLQWQDSYRRAAEEARALGRPLQALTLLLHAEHTDEAVTMAEQVLPPLFRQGLFVAVRDSIKRLPQASLAASATLTEIYGLSLAETGQILAGAPYLQQLGQNPTTRPSVISYLTYIALLQARFQEGQALIEEAKGMWPQLKNNQKIAILIREGVIAREANLDREKALEKHLQALHLAEETHEEALIGSALIALNVTYLQLARSDEALAAALRACAIAERRGEFGHLPTPLLNAAVLHGTRDELDTSEALLKRALHIAEEQQTRTLTNIHFIMSGIHIKRGRLEDAATSLMKAVTYAQHSGRPDMEFLAQAVLGEVFYAQQQNAEGHRQVTLTESLLDHSPQLRQSGTMLNLLRFQQGRRAFAEHHYEEALSLFDDFPTNNGEMAEWAARTRLYTAQIHFEQGRLTEEDVSAFMSLHRPLLSRLYLTPDLPVVRPVLQEAVRRGWYADELADYAFGRSETRRRVFVRTLGRLELTVDGEPLPLTGASRARAQELLALMALLPPATSAELQRTLIGEERGDHRNALQTLRTSLAQATGIEQPVVQDEQRRYTFSGELDVRTDLDELRRATRLRNLMLIRRILGGGTDFLPGLDRPWAADLRDTEVPEALHAAYRVLGTEALERGALAEATTHFEAMQRLFPEADTLRTLIELYRGLGDPGRQQDFERDLARL
ncbi:hypothetical protein K7W42_04465 [Deinococcus sp. HMF7604]|uniref:AAA family ATPase n=1 Tax=Deinococcus betulae TaxID=2873312 RepID=UPI001CCDED01|nr:AAA family ATPase [Deinococcus betulae]MBZ9750113.1 hypothetical protein [Deinococcus betulae]